MNNISPSNMKYSIKNLTSNKQYRNPTRHFSGILLKQYYSLIEDNLTKLCCFFVPCYHADLSPTVPVVPALFVLYSNFLFPLIIVKSNQFQLMLMSVLTALYDTVSQVLRRHVEKRSLFDHLDALMLIIDEIIDGG